MTLIDNFNRTFPKSTEDESPKSNNIKAGVITMPIKLQSAAFIILIASFPPAVEVSIWELEMVDGSVPQSKKQFFITLGPF